MQMKFCRFEHEGKARFGWIDSAAAREQITHVRDSFPVGTARGPEWKQIPGLPLSEAKLLAPVQPSKIVCVGRNYREHAAELGNQPPPEPLIFLKPPSSIIGPGDAILRPRISRRVDYEGELGLVIGRVCRNLRNDEDVRPYILGYTCVNDVTARDLQKKDGQWTRGKGFDTFCPVGPFIADGLDPWAGVPVETRVNGNLKQQGNTGDFIFPLHEVIRYISEVMTLLPGDLIATGTPSGVGPLADGDEVEVTVPGVGALRNSFRDQAG
jgi:2-keto-4-pentenoate hydratase/2-oxohepta-3-ene-1,7-dioic acid hydratase in catechol pathway